MTIETFTPGRKPAKPGPADETTSRQAPRRNSNRVTLFQNGKFGVSFEGTETRLAIAPELIASVLERARPAPEDERGKIIEILGLEDTATQAIDKIAAENDLTFAEAMNFHLAMTLPA